MRLEEGFVAIQLLAAYSTQEALAAFFGPAERVVAMSLHTLKQTADRTLGGDG